jgi:tRNA A37 threonylcarbamoyladenosine dehydratase
LAYLTKYDLERYDRQIRISGFGEEGQKRLKGARVLVAGAGGLGFPTSAYLVAAGVGTVKIVDCESVELSILNRQLLHWHGDVGKRKVESACGKLQGINPTVKVEVCFIADFTSTPHFLFLRRLFKATSKPDWNGLERGVSQRPLFKGLNIQLGR